MKYICSCMSVDSSSNKAGKGRRELSFTCTKLFETIDSIEERIHLSMTETEVFRSQGFLRLLL